jgi:hypothetical protein
MRNEGKEPLDPGTPALVVTYGNANRKVRPLDTDLLLLGRSPACDVHLVSPDVAPVHCVLVRRLSGWLLRDCSGRPGTRVNGRSVQETELEDGDVIQVGAFSFEVRLPGGPAAKAALPAPVLIERLQRSRRHLGRLALRLRKRLGERLLLQQAAAHLKVERAELNQQAESLRVHQREYELRMTRLELSERDLATDRATLDNEYRALQEELQRHTASVQSFEAQAARKERELEQRTAALLAQEQQQDDCTAGPDRQKLQEAFLTQAEAAFRKQQSELERLFRDFRQLLSASRSSDLPERKRGSNSGGKMKTYRTS